MAAGQIREQLELGGWADQGANEFLSISCLFEELGNLYNNGW